MISYKENTKPINVLFVGGGRRVSLAKRFLAKGFKLFSYEIDGNCPISEIAEIITGVEWKNKEIISHLNETCRTHNIDLIIPLQDEAILLCCNLISTCPASFGAADICYDKFEFGYIMRKYDEYPSVPSRVDIRGKVIVKPKFGFNSKGIFVTDSLHNIDWDNYIVQRYIEGTEYSVDCYFNKTSDLIGYVPRERVVVQGGEVIQSTTINRNNPLYKKFGTFISHAFKKIGSVGPYCIQFIEQNGEIFIIEANARFGGGVILSLEAGFDIIDLIISEYFFGNKIEPQEPTWKEDFSMTRYFSEHFYARSID
jgi:carbamoyl-phosphate synthase large subunit